MIPRKPCISVTFSVLFSFFFCFTAFAQKEYQFSFDTAAALPKGAMYSHVKVIDERLDKESFGRMKIKFSIKKLVTADSFSIELEKFGEHLVRKVNPKADNTLLIVLHQLSVEGNIKGMVSTIYINADYYLSTPYGGYQLLFTVDKLNEVKTTDVRRDMNLLFSHLFYTIANATVAQPKRDSIYTETQAANRIADIKKQFPVYNANNYKVGVYYTLEQFLNNTPGDTLFKEDDHFVKIGNSPHFYYVDKKGWRNGRISEKDFFAVYNGERWFKSTSDGSFGMEKDGDDFYFKAERKSINGYTNSPFMTVGYLAGGIVVGAIVDVVDATVASSVTTLEKDADLTRMDITEENPKTGKGAKTKIFYLFKIDPINKTFIPAKRLQ
ncbi:MAG: hypothetical protein JSS96_15140 [Bacteroidetes bacterium]|nr:hypothetical protein [Bacteroidota bacterium]